MASMNLCFEVRDLNKSVCFFCMHNRSCKWSSCVVIIETLAAVYDLHDVHGFPFARSINWLSNSRSLFLLFIYCVDGDCVYFRNKGSIGLAKFMSTLLSHRIWSKAKPELISVQDIEPKVVIGEDKTRALRLTRDEE
ncbi:hypothetical protein KP509_23G080400 [Ceratopteris richardii]|uniref:Uncharacterized protein n=1 Tax=Ceratopteris richardii TaxID=49495 RepID=A0A8T2S2B9_CERRI|nr:hypothetical protein KP509_23G080400 [Ceratopteris richardii]